MCNCRLFTILGNIESFYWTYVGFALVIAFGIYFTIKSKCYQLQVLVHPLRTIKAVHRSSKGQAGISPFRVYFASVGGMVGLGNIVVIITAIMVGGPGALFWLWIASLCGMLIKYAEIYLGMKFRIPDGRQGHHGGPMVYLGKAFKNRHVSRLVPAIFCAFLAIYGIEIVQFVVMTDVITDTFNLPRFLVLGGLLFLTLYGGFGGVRRLANIATALMPPFIILYILACLSVIIFYCAELPSVLLTVFKSAFTGHGAVGGFVGSTMGAALQMGTARAVYSGDLGIGYDSIIQSESKAKDPATQACLSIFGVATDTLICTLSILVVLVTGLWKENIEACHGVALALGHIFPHTHTFMALLIFIAGYTTLIAYITVGEKAMTWLFPQWGRRLYFLFATTAFITFALLDQCHAVTVMSLSGGLLMLTNLVGIWKLRDKVDFKKMN